MAIVDCTATVASHHELAREVYELTFALRTPEQLPYQAGQYIGFRIPVPGKERPASRLYSIASAPSEPGIVRLVYNYVGGPGTGYLRGLAVGQEAAFKGPYGNFLLDLKSTRNVLMVATGTGIAPFLSMLHEHLPTQSHRQITLLWGVRSLPDLYYQKELSALEKAHPHFRWLMPLSRPEPEWTGLKGRVTAIFPDFFPVIDNLEVYACGSDAMIQDLKSLCEARGGCPFHREKYF